MDILNFSKQTKIEAEQILAKTKLLKLLSRFGDVKIGGSFYTELMYGPDIDISVATENPRNAATSFLAKIIKTKVFQRYEYGDFESHPREKRPKANIIVLILPFNNRKWEIEIWFYREHNKTQIKLEEKLKKLSVEQKMEILKLKDKREKSGVSKHSLSSFDIYKNFIK